MSGAHREAEWQTIQELTRLGLLRRGMSVEELDVLYPKIHELVAYLRPYFAELEQSERWIAAGKEAIQAAQTTPEEEA